MQDLSAQGLGAQDPGAQNSGEQADVRPPGQRRTPGTPTSSERRVVPPLAASGDPTAALARARVALGIDQSAGLEERQIALVLEVDAKGVQRSLLQRTRWRAREEWADRFPVMAFLPAPVDERLRVEALEGCEVAMSYTDLGEGLFATSLALGRRLSAGEEVTTLHRLLLPAAGVPQGSYEHQVKQRVDDMTVEVRFSPQCVPVGVGAYVRVGADRESVPVTTGQRSVRVRSGGFGPGALGVHWEW